MHHNQSVNAQEELLHESELSKTSLDSPMDFHRINCEAVILHTLSVSLVLQNWSLFSVKFRWCFEA